MLSILDIIEDTTVDGPGFRTSIYAAGCPNRCPGCHNPESWDIDRGHWMSTDEILEKVLADDFADVTFSGGDPMYQPEGFAKLACAIKEKSGKNIWCYTGYTFETLLRNPLQAKLLQYIDVLVDGNASPSLPTFSKIPVIIPCITFLFSQKAVPLRRFSRIGIIVG